MSAQLKMGMVGFGYWGPNIARNLAKNTDIDFVVLADMSESNRAKFAALYPEVATCTSVEELLSGYNVDAVAIATPAPVHYVVAKQVLEAGKHCFVEKPLTLSSAEARELVELAEAHGLTLQVDHLLKYHSAIQWIKSYIDSGELGEVRYLYMQRLNLGVVRQNENSFWSLAPHDVSIALYLLDETPTSVSASGASYITPGIEDVVFANLSFASGKMVNIHVSWLDPHKTRKFTIVGTKRMLVFDDMAPSEKIIIYNKGVEAPAQSETYNSAPALRFGDVEMPYVPLKEPLSAVVAQFVMACQQHTTPLSDGRDGLHVVQVLEAVDASIKMQGAPVAITQP
ncbi:MAG: Gfo/Idh/MocA family oxidoreductase [Coriobacteriia bacterium]|nr:Gfo/Idh/MocA family oxidoreductase [Coriobacteriia bacterium]